MEDDRPGESPFAYRQWDDKPTWMMDRGRDDHGMHQTNESIPTGFHAALIHHRDKTAQMTDAAIAFITMKKTAGLMGAAQSLGRMAVKNPHLAGAAVGAAGGAIAGGPNHRLGGAAVGGALGAGAGHMLGKAGLGAGAASGAATKAVNPLANQSPEALRAARAEMAGGKSIAGVGQAPASGPPTGFKPQPAAQTTVMPVQQAAPTNTPAPSSSPTTAPAGAVTREMPQSAVGQKNLASFNQHIDSMLAKRPPPPSMRGAAQGSSPPTVPMRKMASLPPFHGADDSKNAALSGGLSAIKSAEVISELSQLAEHSGRLKLPGAGSIVGVADDLAQLGRQKLQNYISSRNHNQQQPQVPPKPAIKMASPYDGTPLMDMKQRAADKYPEVVSPIEALRTDFKSALQLVQDKIHDIGSARNNLFKSATAKIDYKEIAHIGGLPRRLATRGGAITAGTGALIGGGMAYLSSRGKKEHGGRSQAEVDLAKAKAKQPENPDGIRQTIGKHVIGLHHDVAEQMRKHPIAATAMGAGAGAGIALRVAPILGLASRIK